MKKQIIAILIITAGLLQGCGNPEPSEIYTSYGLFNEHQELRANHTSLQNEFNALRYNYESLKGVQAERDAFRDDYNNLALQHGVLQTKVAVLETQYQTLGERHAELLANLSSGYNEKAEALEELNEQYQAMLERHETLFEQIRAVNEKRVKVLSENLTDSEREAFYKGWYLWWDSFEK